MRLHGDFRFNNGNHSQFVKSCVTVDTDANNFLPKITSIYNNIFARSRQLSSDFFASMINDLNLDWIAFTEHRKQIMIKAVFSVTSLNPPDLSLSCPPWVDRPTSNMMFCLCLLIYYLSVSGITYDIINSPPAFGVELDNNGNGRPVAILQWQVITIKTKQRI